MAQLRLPRPGQLPPLRYVRAPEPVESRVRLWPDLFVRLHVPDAPIKSWKTWEDGGVPDLALEIISDSDRRTWDEKSADYRQIGIKEVVRFDPWAPSGQRLRAWARVQEDLVERVISDDRTPCVTLGLNWTVCPVEDEPVGLRLMDDEGRLLESREEVEARGRAEEARARADAEARVRELEEQLRRLKGVA